MERTYEGGIIGEDFWKIKISREEIVRVIIADSRDVNKLEVTWTNEGLILRWSAYQNTRQS